MTKEKLIRLARAVGVSLIISTIVALFMGALWAWLDYAVKHGVIYFIGPWMFLGFALLVKAMYEVLE